ncbi:hypothetical protein BGX21_001579 [Mortierella sp. AD011]|nr:hypothetical protein BGX20_002101 [Mortierella sp. AD010]KAF9383411.1 hypothetical protein BGX21_001579 [Mortierella sp. AD011]
MILDSSDINAISELADLNLTPRGGPDDSSDSDEGLAKLINCCSSATSFEVPFVMSPILTMQALRQHFFRLTRLCVISFSSFGSVMVQETKVSCPMLIQLKALLLEAHDILGAVEAAHNTGTYDLILCDRVCLDLQYLEVDIRLPLIQGE